MKTLKRVVLVLGGLVIALAITGNNHIYVGEFWKQKVTKTLNEELDEDEIFVNLASNEYFKAIDLKTLKSSGHNTCL